ncbi:GNAT family N-acetyltransferase [Streptomyces sp. H51]|uniref:GNAT family N-acetyltransferase n=1 Tax=Streptomyces sp. H51 TaxID=3111770 RepID=UPI002D773D54|nr:GNAT family N-acetyltransferase [Streptomyces sp. H51]
MNTKPFPSGLSENPVVVTRVADRQWHALDDDLVVGRGHAEHRPDGRLFVSIDAWHDVALDRLAEAMPAQLPAPLHTVVDEADVELTAGGRRAGFTIRRREWEYAVPTGPRVTGLGAVLPPSGVTIVIRPRIGLVAVRAVEQRRGIALALLAHALGTLHRSGFATARTEVQESDRAASALFEGIGARPMSSNLELVR